MPEWLPNMPNLMAGAMELGEFLEYANARCEAGDDFHKQAAEQLTHYPVSIREFVESPEYLGDPSVYPANMAVLEQLNNSDGLRIGSRYTEAVLAGGIGVGKSSIAILSLLYQLYVLSCLRSPQRLFDLSDKSEIVFVVQAPTERLAKAVGYSRLRELVLQSPHFKNNKAPDKRVKSELRFSNGVVIRPLSGSDTAALGQNVLGGLLDEVAFAEYTERSTRSRDREAFDQAERQYNAIAMRRKSRFLNKGRLPGLLCLVSSPQYPEDLIERKIRQAQDDDSIFLYQLRLWDVKPDNYSDRRFSVFTGDDNRPPRVLGHGESTLDDLTDEVPIEFKPDFERDIDAAIRDICGRPTLSVRPFFRNKERVLAAFTRKSILSRNSVDFAAQTLKFMPRRIEKPELIRWGHIDLALTRDSAGIAIGYCSDFVEVKGEWKPKIEIEVVLEVLPPKQGEIDYAKIRSLLYKLRDAGMNIRFVSYDGYQSADSRQILQRQHFTTGVVSMDKTTEPYEYLRDAIYDGRVSLPTHEKLQGELLKLEFDARKQKVDHPKINGSKDLADCVAGVVYQLSRRREVLYQTPGGHGVSSRFTAC
jgi:hypothetical protein